MDILFLKKLSNGKYRYYEKFYDESEGKWKQASVTLTSKTRQAQGEAKRLLDKKIDKKLLDYDVEAVNKKRLQTLTVREVYNEYKEFRKQELKDSTYYKQNLAMEKIFVEILDKKIVNISSSYFQRYFMTSKNSIPYKKLQKSLVNLFFKFSVKMGVIDFNPIENVELPKHRKTIEYIEKKRAKFFSKDEMKVFKKSFGTSPDEVRMNYLIEFMYLTGLRIGEALALMWENIDFEENSILIKYNIDNHSVSIKDFKLTSPKTLDSFRRVSINNRCLEILCSLKKMNSDLDVKNDKFIFLNERGNLIYPQLLNKYLKKVGKKANIENKNYHDFSSHMLRHSHISLLTELGVPVKTIMERVGHKDEKTTLQIYTHVTKNMKDDVVEKMNNLNI